MKPWPNDWYFIDDTLTYDFLKKKLLRFDLPFTKGFFSITTVDDKSALVHVMTLPKLMMTQYPMHWWVRMPFAINGLIALISCHVVTCWIKLKCVNVVWHFISILDGTCTRRADFQIIQENWAWVYVFIIIINWPLTCGDWTNPVQNSKYYGSDALAPCIARTPAPMILTM